MATAADAFRGFRSRVVTRQEPMIFTKSSSPYLAYYYYSSVLHRPILQKQIGLGKRRNYHNVSRERLLYPRQVVLRFLVWLRPLLVGGVAILIVSKAVVFGKIKTVPYTNRRQLLFPVNMEKQQAFFENLKASVFKGKILADTHPESLRVRRIANDIFHEAIKSEADSHLVGLDLEVLVVDDPFVNAQAYLPGNIVIFTGTLKFLKDDSEIAGLIAHEG